MNCEHCEQPILNLVDMYGSATFHPDCLVKIQEELELIMDYGNEWLDPIIENAIQRNPEGFMMACDDLAEYIDRGGNYPVCLDNLEVTYITHRWSIQPVNPNDESEGISITEWSEGFAVRSFHIQP